MVPRLTSAADCGDGGPLLAESPVRLECPQCPPFVSLEVMTGVDT